MAKKKSAFVMAGDQVKDIVKEASKTTRSNMLDASQIIEALNMRKGQTVSLICKVSNIKTGVHTDDPTEDKYDENKAGLPYINFQFVPTSGPLKGGTIGNFMACYDREDMVISKEALEWVFREFQGLDYDTDDWGMEEIEQHAEEVNELPANKKPVVSLAVKCNDIKSGKRKGELVVNVRISRLITDDQDDDDDDDDDDDSVPVKPTKPTKPVKAAAEPVKKTRGAKAAPSKPAVEDDADDYQPAVGDKVLYNYTDDDGEVEELTCTITKVNARKKVCDLNDGEYDYDNIKFDEVTPA